MGAALQRASDKYSDWRSPIFRASVSRPNPPVNIAMLKGTLVATRDRFTVGFEVCDFVVGDSRDCIHCWLVVEFDPSGFRLRWAILAS